MNIIEELKTREIFKNITNEEKFKKIKKGDSVYIGFDPTAESLHLGNYFQISILKRFEQYGFKPIAVLGGATGMIGDPSFMSKQRVLLTKEQIEINKEKVKKQLTSFNLKIIDNFTFYKNMKFLDFLKNIGRLINVNYMIKKESVSSRLDTGLSFTEFSYQLIQGWDFKELYEKENVKIQIGGTDQWGNITTGIELIRKTQGIDNSAIGIIVNLLLDKNGQKFGKSTGGGNLWIDKQKKSPFAMYQFFINQPDSEIKKLLLWLTFLKIEKIEKIIVQNKSKTWKKIAHKILAFEVTKDLYGIKEANKTLEMSEKLFSNKDKFNFSNKEINEIADAVPTSKYNFNNDLLSNLISLGVSNSKRELRQIIKIKSIKINGEIISENYKIKKNANNLLVQQGKRNFFVFKK